MCLQDSCSWNTQNEACCGGLQLETKPQIAQHRILQYTKLYRYLHGTVCIKYKFKMLIRNLDLILCRFLSLATVIVHLYVKFKIYTLHRALF